MSFELDTFIKGSNNVLTAKVYEQGSLLTDDWDDLESISVDIGGLLLITRTADEDGLVYVPGIIKLTPGDLVEDLTPLIVGPIKRLVKFVFKTPSLPHGVVYGDRDTDTKLLWTISQNPA